MTELQRKTALTSRLGGGATAIIIGFVLFFKGSLAPYLPWVGALFIVLGIGVILLAFRYARKS